MDVESLVNEFRLYGSVQGQAVTHIQMKCLHELDEAAKLAADAVQLKPILASPSTAAAPAAVMPRSAAAYDSTLSSICKLCLCVRHLFTQRHNVEEGVRCF